MRIPSLLHSVLPPAALLLCAGASIAQQQAITLEQAFGGGERINFRGRTPSWSWADGGLLQGPGGKLFDVASGEEQEAPKEDAGKSAEQDDGAEGRATQPDALIQALTALDGVDEKQAKRIVKARRDASDDGTAILYRRGDETYFYREGAGARQLELPEGLEFLDLSGDGHHLAFVLEGNLWLASTQTGESLQITTDGSESQLNGKLDWVYQEEVYGRGTFKAFWWSPDSTHIAFLSLDESAVHDFTVVDHIERGTFRVKPEITHYPKAGDPNPTIRFGIADATTGKVVWADLSKYDGEEPLVVRVGWTPTGDRALFVVQDRIQMRADLNAADPKTGEWKTLIHESNDSWTNRPSLPRWLEDGSFLWFSERTDHNHLYHYSADGKLIRQVTSGDWSFGRITILDEEAGQLWFSSTKDGAVNGNVYRIGLDGEGLVRLTRGEGQHSIVFNGDRSYFLDRYSSLATPPSVRLCTGEGEIVRELGRAEISAREKYLTSNWELLELPARDGYLLDAALLKPVPFDATRPYPVWISTYSGPDAPSVRNRWKGSTWSQFLAQQGFVQFQVNVRSASGKGHWAIEQCYKQLGVQELRDFEDALDWLCAHEWADASRVGITGHSYGGFMTGFALTHSDRFALGIAGSGVYDWGMYDTIYTERYMSTPQKNPKGYKAASVIEAAEDLSGHLLITHGVMDDNVHVQNAIQLVYALQKAGKMNFSLMLYPQSRHGIGDSALRMHSRRLEWAAMREHLLEVED